MFESVTCCAGIARLPGNAKSLKRFHIVPLHSGGRLFDDYGKVPPDGRRA
jgi:hypothetical protein